MGTPTSFVPIPLPGLDRPVGDVATSFEAQIEPIEHQLGLRITIHDRAAVFSLPDGGCMLTDDRWHHCHPLCDDRPRGIDAVQCLQHCYVAVEERAARQQQAFHHCCWRGVGECVVPIWRGRQHLATLFAGCFRVDGAPVADRHPAVLAIRERLAAREAIDLPAVATALLQLGDQLVACAERLRGIDPRQGQAATIRHFIHYNCQRPIGLADLARHLGCSEGHCSRLVSRTCAASFSDLLLQARLLRATHLLTGSALSVGAIAHAVGFNSEQHFNRAFKRRHGRPPGQWRRQTAAALGA